jgi:myo-inositol catabolism protein IolC
MAGPLLILAADHRASLERDLYGLTRPPAPEQAARISADKLIIYQGLAEAVPQLPSGAVPGILIDEQYGASAAELAAGTGGAVRLAMPIEASGEQWFQFAYPGDWQAHAEFFATDYSKILIRDNPGLDPDQRAGQADRAAQVFAWASGSGRALIIELLVPASPPDLDAAGGDTARYDSDLRPKLTVEVIEYLQEHGVSPAIWMVEGLDRHDDAVAVVAAVRRGGRAADCIAAGRPTRHDQLDTWLRVAAPIPGFIGCAIGRSIWWDALHARRHHRSTEGDARRRITAAYLDFARYYLDAREGQLTAPDPEFW